MRPRIGQRYACKAGGYIEISAINGDTLHYVYSARDGSISRLKTTRTHWQTASATVISMALPTVGDA
jgi:hypothetical protein